MSLLQDQVFFDFLKSNKIDGEFNKIVSNLKSNKIDGETASGQLQALINKFEIVMDAPVTDKKPKSRTSTFHYPQGIRTYLEDTTAKDTLITPIIQFEGGSQDFRLEVAMTYASEYNDKLFAFTNGIINPEGGMHVTGFRSALTKIVNNYATSKNFFKKDDEKFGYDDLKEGVRAILSVKMVDPQFTSQSKVKLGSTIARTLSERIVTDKLNTFFEENPSVAQSILVKAQLAMKARLAARAARDSVLRKGALETTSLPGKLADCSEKDPSKCEIYIVEGDSAGGSAKQGRDRKTQAILPLRGKVLNTEKATLDRIMNYEGIKNMIIAFGAGIGDKFDVTKLRYHKIVLMADADVDGAHITTLLLTFLYRYMPTLIEDGYIYMARPPLYRIQLGRKIKYVYSDDEKADYLRELLGDQADLVLNLTTNIEDEEAVPAETSALEALTTEVPEVTVTKPKFKKPDIQRYKGLGEMNPDQLWDTTMDPAKRFLYQVTIGEAALADQIFDELMGSEVEPRKRFIDDNAMFVKDLDLI